MRMNRRGLLWSGAALTTMVLGGALGGALAVTSASAAGGGYWTPQVGDPDRKAILNALRPVVEQATGGPVLFVVDILRTDGTWAYAQGTPQRPGGQPINWMATPLAQQWQSGMMSDVVMGLMVRSQGRWLLVEHVIGPTDVAWIGWAQQHGLPHALFGAGN